jgi:Peptidase_C39 like family
MRRRRRILTVVLVIALTVAALAVAGLLAPAALAHVMDVPVFKQADPEWAGLRLGGSTYTMRRSGCAVTASAMVAAYFGSTKDPGELARALNASRGLTSEGDLYWQSVPSAARGSIKYVGRYSGASLSRINKELDSGYPVIVKVNRKGNTHFVVLTGRSGSTYYINDPAEGDRTTLNKRYGDPRKAILAFRIYRGTPAPATAAKAPARYQQADAGVKYRGTWTVSSNGSASGGSFRYADSARASVTITFKGTYLGWITKKSPLYGRARVTVDGGKPVIVDLYSARTLWRQKVWETGRLKAGTHTVKIEWTGRKNASAKDANIGVDGFDVIGKLVAPPR